MSALRSGKHTVDGGKNPGSVFLERIECSGRGKTLQHAFVYRTRIDARRKVREIAMRLAMSEADLYRKQRVAIEAVAAAMVEMEQRAREEDIHIKVDEMAVQK